MGGGYSTLCVCVYYHKICLSLIISKSKQVAGLKLGILREKVVLYKTGKFLQASVPPIACKFEIKKN